ncbi:anacyclamide/piricyclamide family prenylated cyclic peptide [Planktothrix agardhii]|uniref:anacyclamide/piricyclamide family prenylated cyclic peptide n=1 Tax=Planktothrix agardhii TaxID=1160 RepID=UPI0039B10B3F
MTKKNLKPQQAAPVQREINTTSSVDGTGEGGSTGLIPLFRGLGFPDPFSPFAGDDAE